MTALERMQRSRERRTASGRRIELILPDEVIDALDALAKKRSVSRARIVEDLALAGLHSAPDVAGIVAKPDCLRPYERAAHEVGHALAALRYRIPFETVTVLPMRGLGGHIRMTPRTVKGPSERDLEKEVFHLMAGEAAHRAVITSDDESIFTKGSSQDRAEARRLLQQGLGWTDAAKIEGFIDRQLHRAMRWAQEPQVIHQIDCVAHELLQLSTMSRSEVADLVRLLRPR